MKFLALPLNEHVDYGYGMIGQEFKSAAEQLLVGEQGNRNTQLPINYLYRHAIELFLKSTIITLHRSLKIPFGDQPSEGEPYIKHKERWTLLRTVHDLYSLYSYFQRLLADYAEDLGKRCKTDWADTPEGLDGWIAAIQEADRTSTYFRYPTTGNEAADAAKSTWKQADADRRKLREDLENESTMSFMVLNENEQIVRSYVADRFAGNECREALTRAADALSGAQLALRMELAGGY